MVCGVNHAMHQIHNIVGDHDLIMTARDMAQHGFLVIDPMGPQLLAYLQLRNIDPHALVPQPLGAQNLLDRIFEVRAPRGG